MAMPAECIRRIDVSDGGVAATLLIRGTQGTVQTAPVEITLSGSSWDAVHTALGRIRCEAMVLPKDLCLTNQPWVVVGALVGDGGLDPLLSYSLGDSARPSPSVLGGLDVLFALTSDVWADAGVGYLR